MYLARFYVYSVAAQGNLEALLARALQECPMSGITSGILLSIAIWSETRTQRKTRCVDVLKECASNYILYRCLATVYWAEWETEKAHHGKWFNRAVSAGPDLCDAWSW